MTSFFPPRNNTQSQQQATWQGKRRPSTTPPRDLSPRLRLRVDADRPLEDSRQLEGVREGQARELRGQRVPEAHGEHGREEDDKGDDDIEPCADPAAADGQGENGPGGGVDLADEAGELPGLDSKGADGGEALEGGAELAEDGGAGRGVQALQFPAQERKRDEEIDREIDS